MFYEGDDNLIKQIWTVRSPERLFVGLACAICGVMTLYTVLNFWYLPPQIPMRLIRTQSRLLTVVLPVVHIALCAFFVLRYRKNGMLFPLSETADSQTANERRRLSRQTRVICMMLCSVALAFWQLDCLNTAKELPGFGLFVPVLCGVLALLMYVRGLFRIHSIK